LSLDGLQAPEVRDLELDGCARRIDPPACLLDGPDRS